MITTEHDGPVWTVRIDRPQRRNAVDRATAEALVDAFRAFEESPEARVAILHGSGGTFCAGADLKEVAAGRPNRLEATGDGPMGPSRMRLTKPVIAAISGHAVAGGLELALWCDLRVAEESAILGVFCRRWGVPLIDGGTARLPRLIGLSWALDLILTGRAVDSSEALRIGLVNRVVPDGSALTAARALAKEIAAFPNATMLADRASAYGAFDRDMDAALAAEFRRGMQALREESQEGAKRFVASRASDDTSDD